MGFNVLGDWDSPVMPIMVFNPGKLAACSREMLKRGVAVVVVGFPATPLLTARVRVCISACHSKEDLDFALEMFGNIAELCALNLASQETNAMHLKLAKSRGIQFML
jgi:serine palmitoyltransferase